LSDEVLPLAGTVPVSKAHFEIPLASFWISLPDFVLSGNILRQFDSRHLMDLMDKVRRMSAGVQGGERILEYLKSPAGLEKLVAAAERGTVPVAAISQDLLRLVGRPALDSTATRQFIGLACRALLQEEHFVVARTGVKVRRDPVFTAGAVYMRAPAPRSQTSPLLARLLDALSVAEARQAITILNARLQQLSSGGEKDDD
jgi:hypothetical protein